MLLVPYGEPNRLPDITLMDSRPTPPSGPVGIDLDKTAMESQVRLLENRQDGIIVTLLRLSALLQDDEYDEDYLPPTRSAFNLARQFIFGVRPLLHGNVPAGSLSADGAGGIRVDWQSGEREVRLVLPGKKGGRMYIYHQQSEEYAAEYTVSAETLAHWLNWLINR